MFCSSSQLTFSWMGRRMMTVFRVIARERQMGDTCGGEEDHWGRMLLVCPKTDAVAK